MKKHEKMKQLKLFDPKEERILKIWGQNKWVESIWNENTWYYQDERGFSIYDDENRNTYHGSMLPQKHYICQDGNN